MHNTCRRAFGFCLAVVLLGMCSSRTGAVDYIWNSPSSGSWNSSSVWNPNGVPGAADRAYFQLNGSYTASLNATSTTVRYLSQLADGTVTLDLVNQNKLRATGSGGLSYEVGVDPFVYSRLILKNGRVEADQLVRLGWFTSSDGGITVSSGGTLVGNGATVGGSGYGVLRFFSGGTGTFSGPVSLATNVNGVGQIEVNGAGSTATISNTLTIGVESTARGDVVAGGTLSAQHLIIAANTNGNALLAIADTNSLVSVSGNMMVGQLGRGGLTIGTGSQLRVTGDTVFASGAGSQGNATISGVFESQNVYVGGSSSAAGGASTIDVGTGAAAQILGTLRLYATGAINQTAGTVFAQNLVGPAGTYRLTGGTLTVGTNYDHGTGPLPTALTLNANTVLLIGSTISLSSDTITVSGGRIEADRLVGTGAGRIVLNSGEIRIYGSSVVLAGAGSAFGATPTFGAGSLLQAPGTTLYPTTLASGGALTLANNSTVRANTVINNGTLIGQGSSSVIDGKLDNRGLLNGSGRAGSVSLGTGSVRNVSIVNATPVSGFDQWRSDGLMEFGGNLVITVDGAFQPATPATLQLFEFTSSSGAFNSVSVSGLASGWWLDTSPLYSTGAVVIAPVPEPGAILAVAAGLLGLRRIIRRQRQNVPAQVG